MTADEARERFAGARVARLATVTADGRPHLVPVCFAVDGDTVYSAVDAKPKATTDLKRLRNAATHPQVALLADHYDDDWTALWWVRADGTARILDPADRESGAARALLSRRYRQYAERPPEGPVLAVDVTRWSGWAAAPTGYSPDMATPVLPDPRPPGPPPGPPGPAPGPDPTPPAPTPEPSPLPPDPNPRPI